MCRLNLRTIALLIAVILTYAPFLVADELTAHGPLYEIVVTADPLADVDEHTALPIQVLTKEQLESRSIHNIGEAVANELGVSSSDFGAAVGRPVIRGLGGSRVSVLENGINTMDVANMGADHAVPTEPAFARQIEIFRGPATLLFGSGASGGVVNVVNDRILKYIPEDLDADISLQYETVNDGVNGAGSFSVGAGNFAFHVDGMKRYTGDYNIPGFAELDRDPDDEMEKGVVENSSIETESVASGASWIGKRGFIGFSVSRLDNNYGILGDHHHHGEEEEHHEDEDDHGEEEGHHEDEDDHDEEEGHHEEEDHDEEEGHDKEEDHDEEEGRHEDEEDHHEEDGHGGEGSPRIDLGQTRYDFEASLNDPFIGIHRIKTRISYNDYHHDEIESDGNVGVAFDNEEMEARVEVVHHPLGGWQGAVGLQYHHKDFAAIGEEDFVLPSELESIAVFLLEKGDLGNWHMEFGARYEYQDTSTDNGEETSHELFSVSGGLNWDYRDGYQLGLIATHAQRAPSLEELYAGGPHLATSTFEYGDADLGKEKSANIDLYWRKTTGRLTLTANLFYNRIDDFIFLREQDLNGDGAADWVHDDFAGDLADIQGRDEDDVRLLVAQVQDDAEFMGFELEGVVHALEGDSGSLDIRLWADYVEGKRTDNVNLPRITPWRFGAGMTYFQDPWYATLSYTRVNKQNDIALFETPTAGYDLLNLYASYRLSQVGNNVTLFARASNLLDEEIRRHTSFVKELAPLPGRSGIVGVRLSF